MFKTKSHSPPLTKTLVGEVCTPPTIMPPQNSQQPPQHHSPFQYSVKDESGIMKKW